MKIQLTLDSRNKYEKRLIESIRKSPDGEVPLMFAGIVFHGRVYGEEGRLTTDNEETYEVVTFGLEENRRSDY